ncbi:MAG: hypothetical protein GTO30_20030 [Acidobacteria bacterium]|nr:hypothetical protein [Acidobacteriota bacterium]NIQ84218.1 hypothetical protein [Acidobacteriota bacterium]
MNRSQQRQEDIPRTLPVFPLSSAVFFPGTTLPLHVFEPRYRAMVRDAQDRDGLFAVALETDD